MTRVTMLNGLPITMLNGPLGCNCQQAPEVGAPLGNLPDQSMGALVVIGTALGIAYLSEPKKKALNGIGTDIAKDAIGKVIMIGAGVGALYLFIAKPLLQKVGVVDSKEDKQGQAFATSATSPFNPQFYKGKAVTITRAFAEKLAEQIHSADGFFNDDEDAVYAAFRQMKTKNDVSWVADNFQQKYSKDLYTYVRAFMSDDEISIVHGIVNNLR
jgi:hypothetical protein